ncbi:uncharacterized protein LOC121868425 isoform X2 [Homarus americanus]|uniref:uncharacterized protein LOC121868425 isoform X2 n=1 Tax=Homarus americanus TaxID=6706 RepID=UPI001C48BE0E|nr:uncharacterized protein LOC121868425 isoform X2 [Homarus americanus]
MEDDKEGLKDVILEELARLGVQENPKRSSHGQGSKLLGITNSNNISSKSGKSKSKGKRSPRISGSRSPLKHQGSNKGGREDRKHTAPKSPFSSAKRRAEQRRQHSKDNKKVFGRELGNVPSVCVYLSDGIQVTVPEFMVDVCSLIRRNITVEGIFRKAGSSQRQSDIKKLIDSGNSLPNSVHVVDAACLLKQFLRCLPDPILSSEVHSKIIKCMELAQETKIEAILLCTMLLPQTHRHTLVYLMDFFSDVVTTSSSNLMDARNLAIVLAPNLLPTTITLPSTSSWKSSTQFLTCEDAMLATNIEVLQLLIENASLVCRLPRNLALALEHREKSKSTENLIATTQPHTATRKKRRSASIHRLMTGLRRVVGHSRADSGSPLRAAGSAEELDSLHLHPGIALSPMPGTEPSPRKRKSADAFDLCLEPTSKRAKVELAVDTVVGSSATTTSAVDAASSAVSASLPLLVSTTPSLTKKQNFKVGQPCFIREVTGSRDILAQSPGRPSLLGNSKPSIKRTTSAKIGTFPKSPSTNVHTVHAGINRKSLGRVESLRIEPLGLNKVGSHLKTQSQATSLMSPVVRPVLKRRSCDIPLRTGVKRVSTSEEPVRVRHRSNIGRRMSQNEPDGADVSTLGPRGVPDGAECTLRNQMVPKPRVSDCIETLEQHYDDIKSVVKTMEDEYDKSNVQQMKEVYFPDNSSTSAQNMSYSEMIQNAYERMKVETKDLGVSPSDNLSKRLGKELKIRNRRSGEHRVIRSPSERKIGTIRRRSRELVQNAAKSLINVEDTPTSKSVQTPKMKGTLMQTPISTSLRRGRPNSVKSGLPFVVRTSASNNSDSPMQFEETTPTSVGRKVVISKRNDDSHLRGERNNMSKVCQNEVSLQQRSRNMNISNMSGDESLIGSFLEQLPGPMTRRRSSLLSLVSNVSAFKLSSTETSLTDEYIRGGGNSSAHKQHNTSGGDTMETNKQMEEHNKEQFEVKKTQSAMMAVPQYYMSGSGEQWLSATEFINCLPVEDQEVSTGDENVGRPSLAALMKQKKVTANVQLFNNLHTDSPYQLRRQSRLRYTPHQLPPERSSVSDRNGIRLSYSKSMSHRSTMTPRELLKVRQKSLQFDKPPLNPAKIAVVSPLKESTWLNIQREHSHETPKAYKGEATAPRSLLKKNEAIFKTPESPVTSGFPNVSKSPASPFMTPSETSHNPPKLPPRASIRPSPIRIQYR